MRGGGGEGYTYIGTLHGSCEKTLFCHMVDCIELDYEGGVVKRRMHVHRSPPCGFCCCYVLVVKGRDSL